MGIAPSVRKFLSEIGRRGGQKSKRSLSPEQARAMVRAREFKRQLAKEK